MNIIILNEFYQETDRTTLFGEEEVLFISDIRDYANLLVTLGAYPTTSKARAAGRSGPIPLGWTDHLRATKKLELFIWNPFM